MNTYTFGNRVSNTLWYTTQASSEAEARGILGRLIASLEGQGLRLPLGQWYLHREVSN